MDSNRQRKINQLLQEELAEIFRKLSAASSTSILISLVGVKVSPDLSIAKVYLSIFPQEYRDSLLKEIIEKKSQIKKILGIKIAQQLRKTPELNFYLDTSLDDVEKIEKALRGEEDKTIL